MKDWQIEYLDLKNQMDKYDELLSSLVLENNQFKSEIKTLNLKNEKLSAENIKLKDRLGLNSKNSSIPTSKELYKIKKDQAKKSTRKQGAQAGHKPNVRDPLVADEIVKVDLKSSECECGGEICSTNKVHIHQKIDIPEIQPHVTEYHLQKGRCKSCGKRKKAPLPEGVTADLFGSNVKTAIGSLTGFYKNSKREVANILKNLFNLQISVGTISNNEARIAKKCLESYEDIELELSYSRILHIDETSHYNKGKMGWCWLFASKTATLIKLESSRGKKVLENSVFGSDDHLIITDRYAAYNYFNADERQVCWSHLARDFERFANSSYVEIKDLGEYLGANTRELFALKKALQQEQLTVLRFQRRARKLRKRIWYHLAGISHKAELPHASRAAKNMMKNENMMWRFLDDPNNIPLTNNHAEQQIRHYVTYRKNSYFTQSKRGNDFLERVISLYLTWKKQGQNPVQNLRCLMSA